MTLSQIYIYLGLPGLLLALITGTVRGIFRTGQLIQMMKDIQDDIREIKEEQKDTRKWIYNNAIRNPPRR